MGKLENSWDSIKRLGGNLDFAHLRVLTCIFMGQNVSQDSFAATVQALKDLARRGKNDDAAAILTALYSPKKPGPGIDKIDSRNHPIQGTKPGLGN